MSKKNKPHKPTNNTPLKGLFLVIIAVSLGALYFFFRAPEQHPPVAYTEPVHSLPKMQALPTEHPDSLSQKAPIPALPKVAIIIDDIGHRQKIAMDILKLDLNLSFSVLPRSPYAKVLSEEILASGKDLLLHLPLEPTDSKWDPGPGALMLSMSPKTLTTTFRQNLSGFPFIGINNHMGSKFTADQNAMNTLLSAIKSENLFFIDSLTSSKSVAYATAKKLGVKTAKRNIFLDNEQTPQAVQKQLVKLIAVANKHGQAIAIGHPYPATLKALSTFKDTLLENVTLVGIHELVE